MCDISADKDQSVGAEHTARTARKHVCWPGKLTLPAMQTDNQLCRQVAISTSKTDCCTNKLSTSWRMQLNEPPMKLYLQCYHGCHHCTQHANNECRTGCNVKWHSRPMQCDKVQRLTHVPYPLLQCAHQRWSSPVSGSLQTCMARPQWHCTCT